MTEDLQRYEASIKKKHSFNWTPKFESETQTSLNKKVVIPIVIKTFEKLGWDVVFQDETSAEAKRKGDWNGWTEKISVIYEHGKVKVKSISLGNEMWDNGKNSKRVRLFIYAFQQTEKEFDQKALEALEEEVERINNWDDYKVPESLPQPKERKKAQILIPIIGGAFTSLLLGLIIAFLSVKGFYVIGLVEVGVAFVMGLTLKQTIKIGNYTTYNHLHYLLIGMILITYISNQYFQYQIIISENNFQPFGFWAFIQAKLEAGLRLESFNTGWIGFLISWALQLVITYFVGVLKLASALTAYQLERVPMEVVDFAFYHFVKEKTEAQVRTELSKMGWTAAQDQDEVFKSIAAVQEVNDLKRME